MLSRPGPWRVARPERARDRRSPLRRLRRHSARRWRRRCHPHHRSRRQSCPRVSSSSGLAFLVETMDMGGVGLKPYLVARADAELADVARRDAAELGRVDIEEGVAAEMLGGAHGTLPALAVAADADVLGPDADRGRAITFGDLLPDQIHARRADEAGNEKIGRPLVQIQRRSVLL